MARVTTLLRVNLLLTDFGFISYWVATAGSLLPESWLFKDYNNPILQAWNWSFAPVDLLASAAGLSGLYLARQGHAYWRPLLLVSLTLTFCAGFMAISFWSLRRDFDLTWWLPNLYLAAWPVLFVHRLGISARREP